MSRSPFIWANPLDDPPAVAVAGLLLVLLTRLAAVDLSLALLIAMVSALGLARLRLGRWHRGDRLRNRRVRESIDAALQRAAQLAVQAELLSDEAMARFQDPGHLEPLGLVQLCCERWGGCRSGSKGGGPCSNPAAASCSRRRSSRADSAGSGSSCSGSRRRSCVGSGRVWWIS